MAEARTVREHVLRIVRAGIGVAALCLAFGVPRQAHAARRIPRSDLRSWSKRVARERSQRSDSQKHAQATQILEDGGDVSTAVPLLIELLGSRESELASAAGEELRSIGVPAVPALVAALSNRSSRDPVIADLADILGEIGDPTAVAVLAKASVRSGPGRERAFEALVRIGEPSVPIFRRSLESANAHEARMGVVGLARVLSREAVPDLIQALDGKAPLEAVRALQRLEDRRAVKPLLAFLGQRWDPKQGVRGDVRTAVTEALTALIGSNAAKRRIARIAGDAEIAPTMLGTSELRRFKSRINGRDHRFTAQCYIAGVVLLLFITLVVAGMRDGAETPTVRSSSVPAAELPPRYERVIEKWQRFFGRARGVLGKMVWLAWWVALADVVWTIVDSWRVLRFLNALARHRPPEPFYPQHALHFWSGVSVLVAGCILAMQRGSETEAPQSVTPTWGDTIRNDSIMIALGTGVLAYVVFSAPERFLSLAVPALPVALLLGGCFGTCVFLRAIPVFPAWREVARLHAADIACDEFLAETWSYAQSPGHDNERSLGYVYAQLVEWCSENGRHLASEERLAAVYGVKQNEAAMGVLDAFFKYRASEDESPWLLWTDAVDAERYDTYCRERDHVRVTPEDFRARWETEREEALERSVYEFLRSRIGGKPSRQLRSDHGRGSGLGALRPAYLKTVAAQPGLRLGHDAFLSAARAAFERLLSEAQGREAAAQAAREKETRRKLDEAMKQATGTLPRKKTRWEEDIERAHKRDRDFVMGERQKGRLRPHG